MKRALSNILLLFLVAFPIWFAGLWLTATARMGPQGHWWEAVGFYFLIMAPPLLLGGVIQQVVVRWLVPASWSSGRRRAAAMVSTLTVPLAFLLFRTDPGLLLSAGMVVPMAIALLAYGVVMRLPEAT